MESIWIMGVLCLATGLVFAIPKYKKLSRCKGEVTGIITGRKKFPGTNSIRAAYEYEVDGVKYTADTGWTTYGKYIAGKACAVLYDPQNPENSYVKKSGQEAHFVTGVVFIIAGIAILCLGATMSMG